jgi:trehalose 6-phosphate synthase/phosphatase
LKGIPLKLTGIEKFLEANPKWHGKVVFVIIGLSARENGEDYRCTQRDTNAFVSRINGKFRPSCGGDVVIFEEQEEGDVFLRRRLSFFAASDVLLITATRDGLNRTPMEFTIARSKNKLSDVIVEGAGLSTEGQIIISEFVSSARVMRGGLMINPWGSEDIENAILRVLEMPRSERADRMRRNLEFSSRLTTSSWTMQVLQDLKSVEKSEDSGAYTAIGFAMGMRVVGVRAGFQAVDVSSLSKAYRNSVCRLILLDWGGTLVAETEKTDKLRAYAIAQGSAKRAGPSEALKEILEALCADPRNTVFVVSGKDSGSVGDFWGGIKGLGLGAEHGFYYKWPIVEGKLLPVSCMSTGKRNILADGVIPFSPDAKGGSNEPSPVARASNKWQSMMPLGDQSWKESASMIMNIYMQRTHGTYIEKKGNALIWQFRDADPEFGFMQSKELEEHLKEIMSHYAVEVIRGGGVSDGYIEVRPSGVSKGCFFEHALSGLRSVNDDVDFIMTIGDDSSDEPMFEQVSRLSNVEGLSTFSITVGKKPSSAASYIDDPSGVMELLSVLVKTGQRDKKYFSSIDLSSAQGRASSPTHRVLGSSITKSASELSIHNQKGFPPIEPRKSSGIENRQNPIPLSPSGNSLPRSSSLVDITMKEYLENIASADTVDEDGEEGVFF